MSKYNYITDKRLTGGMIDSIGITQQDLISIKYIFDNLDKGLDRISFEGDDDFTLFYSNGFSRKCQCKVNFLRLKDVVSLCNQYNDNSKHTIIGSGMDDDFRNFYQNLVRYRNACLEEKNKQNLEADFKEYCSRKKIDFDVIKNFDFDSVDCKNAITFAKCAAIEYGNRNHIYIDADELITKLGGKINLDLRPHSSFLTYDQIREMILKNRVKKSIGVFESDPILSDYVKAKVISELGGMELKHTRYREQLYIIRYSIEINQYDQAKNEVLDIIEEEDWIIPIYCWLLNRLNNVKEMEAFIYNYKGNSPQVLFELSKFYYLNKKYEKALEIMKGFLKDSEWPEVYMLYALIYTNMQKYDEAIKNVEKCIELDDSFADAYILLASLIKEMDAKKAVSYLRKAKCLDEKNPNIYYELSEISQLNDDFILSAKYLKEYLNLSGNEDIKELVKLPVLLNYVNDEKWKDEYFNVVQKIQNKPKKEDISIPIVIFPKNTELWAVYIFHCQGNTCYLEKNGNIISDMINTNYIFGIGTYASGTNNWLVKFNDKFFSNPARLMDESVEPSAFSPTVFCYTKSYEAYNKILNQLLETSIFTINHDYSETCKEYYDCESEIKLEVGERNGTVQGTLKITDNLNYSFTIYNKVGGYKKFCDAINKSPFEEAMFIITMNDNIHKNIFVFRTNQIELK